MSTRCIRNALILTTFATASMSLSIAAAADEVTGAFQCNAEKIPIRGAIARWEPASRKLTLTLFKNPPSPDAIRHWAGQSGGSGVIPQGMDYFARITYTLKDPGASPTQAAIESYHFYIHCPTLQMNLNRSVFTRRDMKGDLPDFNATLKPGGRLKASLKGAEEMGMKVPTKATWDLRVDTAIHVK
jgi:hypothetical protein